MRAASSEFRLIFLVYCLQRQEDGTYIALNRRSVPVGLAGTEWVDHEAFPVRFKFKRALTARQIAALSFDGDTAAERIYLYNDGCIPTSSAEAWSAYAARLERLAAIGIRY